MHSKKLSVSSGDWREISNVIRMTYVCFVVILMDKT